VDEIVIQRWKKYGHDRGYAALPDGTKLGWVDLKTGDVHFETEYDAIVDEALCGYFQVYGTPVTTEQVDEPAPVPDSAPHAPVAEILQPASVPTLAPEPGPGPPPEPTYVDLSTHRAGQAVRAKEAEVRAELDARHPIAAPLARFLGMRTEDTSWRVGAQGEEYVGSKLDKLLDMGWHVLHSVPVGAGDSDIDHIVIGTPGVFTINTKNHRGSKIWVAKYQMRVAGQPVPYLRNARHEAARAAKLLSTRVGFPVPTMGIVVVLTGGFMPDVTYRDVPDDVRVLDKWDVPKWFTERPEVLTPDQVNAIYDVARRSTSWTS
jgi:hypothetical protein